MVDGHQRTIAWHVSDIKSSHVIPKLNDENSQMAAREIRRGEYKRRESSSWQKAQLSGHDSRIFNSS